MKVVGLVSGGKDSIFNLLQCISAGHDVVALANIEPNPATGEDELDSFMFQTVGHEAIVLLAEATSIPLFRQTTLAKSYCRDLNYLPTPSDEVEDLFSLLSKVKIETGCEGVAVGAIASEYQRTRVENVCSRLGLTSLAYLWRQNQAQLLRAMIESKIDAITVKVASMGLRPDRHLGMSLSNLEPIVTELNNEFGVNICGEGGEYETFVLDCPLFHKKIILDDAQIVQYSTTDIAASGHLVISSARLEPKFGDLPAADTWQTRLSSCKLLYPPTHYISECLQESSNKEKQAINCDTSPSWQSSSLEDVNIPRNLQPNWLYVNNIYAGNIEEAFKIAIDSLKRSNLSLSDIIFVGLWLRDMGAFAGVNRDYIKCLQGFAPSRACVATTLPSNYPILLELIASDTRCEDKKIVHVQSVSHWAPSNIGPYSQCVKVGSLMFVAGQIPLIPGSMTLLEGSLSDQLRLSLRHAERILEVAGTDINRAMQITVFVSKDEYIASSVNIARNILSLANTAVTSVGVAGLPRSADIEVLVVASNEPVLSSKVIEDDFGKLKCRMELCYNSTTVAIVSKVDTTSPKTEIEMLPIDDVLRSCYLHSGWELGLRIFYNSNEIGLQEALTKATTGKSITLIPVPSKTCMIITGLGHTPKS